MTVIEGVYLGVGGFYKLAVWLDDMYIVQPVALVQSECAIRPVTVIWLADTEHCLLSIHLYVYVLDCLEERSTWFVHLL